MGVVVRVLGSYLARLNIGLSDLPTDELVALNRGLMLVRSAASVAVIVACLVLRATVVPDLALGWIFVPCAALALGVPYRLWAGSGRSLGALLCVQGMVDVALLTLALVYAPSLHVQFNLASLLAIVPFALFLFVVVALLARFRGSRLAAVRTEAANTEAASAAATASALLTVAQALAGDATRSALLERVADLARELVGSTWACILVRDVERGVYRIMGLASRSGQLDEEILSVEFPNALVQWIIDGATDDCLEVRSTEGTPLNPKMQARWTIGPFIGAVLRRDEEPLGILMVGQDDPVSGFRPATRRLVTGIANQAVLALENARLLDELRVANALKTDFIGAMSHELRSPLHAVIGYADMLREEAASEGAAAVRERVDILDRVRIYTSQLLELIQATLDLGRLEAGRVPVHAELVDLRAFVDELGAGIPEHWRKPGVELEWVVAPELSSAHVDAAKLRTVVRNLIDNALKFTDSGYVRVELALGYEPGLAATSAGVPADLVVTVSDTGIGIPSEHRQVIFEMFRQGDGSFSRKHDGVGLGLYIVQRLLQAIDGAVNVESEPGRGSRFTVVVPVRVPVPAKAATATRGAAVG